MARSQNGWRVLAAAAALVAVIAVGIAVVMSRDGGDESSSDLAATIAQSQFSSSARRVHLESPSGNATAEAVLLRDGTGYLVSADLPRLDRSRTYQLWGVDGPTTVSLGVLGPDLGPSAFKFVGNPEALAITEEVAGGVAQTANRPVVAGNVPRV
jgi:anti-sigma-K factor RskA